MINSRVIVISGSMGSGKTTVMGEASDLLLAQQVLHSTIDLDAIGTPLLPEPLSGELHYRNLSAVYENCRHAGIHTFLIAAAIESHDVLIDLRRALPSSELIVCRLTATVETMADRLRAREPGIRQKEFLDRSRDLEATLDRVALEDFAITNDGRNITEVAKEMLERAAWV